MPELPEVETVCRSLNQKIFEISKTPKITNIYLWRKDLRFKIPAVAIKKQFSQSILNIHRRAKFIVIEFKNNFIVSHLGMTGSWSYHNGDLKKYTLIKHDHVALEISNKLWLIYNDPRRFGFLLNFSRKQKENYFNNYGYEPLEMSDADCDQLFNQIKSLKAPVKSVIMNQKHLVGVGNIYASEALFLARIKPTKSMNNLKKTDFKVLVGEIKMVLEKAIASGGSSIKNYRNLEGETGGFQQQHWVYDKEGFLCGRCKVDVIKKVIIGGRSTFYCAACQDV